MLTIGCRSMNRALFTMPTAALPARLPALDTTLDASALLASDGATPSDAERLFQLELKRNLMEPEDSAKFGYIKLQIINASMKRTGRGFQVFQMVTLMTPSFLGVPLEYFRTTLQAELHIIDVHGNTLATYTGKGASKIRVAMYHGYSQKGAPRLADIEALRQALNEIRPQLANDASALREQLLAAAAPDPVVITATPDMITLGDTPDSPAPTDSTETRVSNK
ncbi:hypothetical protein E5J99_08855 [Hymenobacter elongatus]|uniref:Uncharacterized protein n=1 Tax=Hymenobacter elongatus TaxID=877208 RepID=A0A4Z0PPN9_9BACT|nr:hypothetical protein E5J99_08855 [Hymenobacter elongatus]